MLLGSRTSWEEVVCWLRVRQMGCAPAQPNSRCGRCRRRCARCRQGGRTSGNLSELCVCRACPEAAKASTAAAAPTETEEQEAGSSFREEGVTQKPWIQQAEATTTPSPRPAHPVTAAITLVQWGLSVPQPLGLAWPCDVLLINHAKKRPRATVVYFSWNEPQWSVHALQFLSPVVSSCQSRRFRSLMRCEAGEMVVDPWSVKGHFAESSLPGPFQASLPVCRFKSSLSPRPT